MRHHLVFMTFVLHLGCHSVLPVWSETSSSPTFTPMLNPEYVLLREIRITAPIKAYEEGVIVEVRTRSLSDPAFGAVIRYPGTQAVLPLRNDHTQVLSPPAQIPNQWLVEVQVHVLAVPKEITAEGLHIIFLAFDKIVAAAMDAGLRKQPLLKILSGYIFAQISGQTKSYLHKGRILGTARIGAHDLAMLSGMGMAEIRSENDQGIPDGSKFIITAVPVAPSVRPLR